MDVDSRLMPGANARRRRIFCLERLPLRPATARLIAESLPEEPESEPVQAPVRRKSRPILELDPGWMLTASALGPRIDPLTVIAAAAWWPATDPAGPVSEFIGRLWRYSVAVSVAARWLAAEAGDPDPEGVARAALLCRLGCWAVAAVDPEWLVRWWRIDSPLDRRQREIADLELDLDDLGRRLAHQWGCEPLVIESAWLHGEHGKALHDAASEPGRLTLIQEACRWAGSTPWSLERREPISSHEQHRLRLLVAEVQARTSGPFAAPDSTPHEERLTRQNARLRLSLAAERLARERADRFLQALADSRPAESPQEWASRSAMVWCAEPDVTAARVDWIEPAPNRPGDHEAVIRPLADDRSSAASPAGPAPALVIPLSVRGRACALLKVWSDCDPAELHRRLSSSLNQKAWESWAALVSDRAVLETRLQRVTESFRRRIEAEDARLQESKLGALCEFAAGAGHELNNPLAVIAGRAQLLLSRTDEPATARSLQIMLNQATRAHRILRDLIFVARPPAPRLRACRPSELIREAVRTFEVECAARQIRLPTEIDDAVPAAWADPEGLRQLAEILLRNAIEATPSGGTIHVGSRAHSGELHWWFSDTGKGITKAQSAHIFDPFYCGREAGRGLGLGLPRAARLVSLAGGRIDWSSNPGQGTLFQVYLPLQRPPEPIEQPPPSATAAPANGHSKRKVKV